MPLGVANVVREGSDLTIVAHSYTVRRALTVADRLATEGIEVEVIDLRSLRPLDAETVCASVTKTSRALIAEEGWSTYGVGAELAARIQRACFDDLDAPVERVGGAEVPMPYAKPLELAALDGEDKIEAAARSAARRVRPAGRGSLMAIEIPMPRLSDTMERGTVARWAKKEGDTIAEGEVLADIETDKATMELESYENGVLLKILVQEGESAELGAPIALVGEAGETVEAAAGERRRARRAPTPADAPRRAEAAPAPAARSRRRRARDRTPRTAAASCARARSPGAWPPTRASTCGRSPAAARAPTGASSRSTSSASPPRA